MKTLRPDYQHIKTIDTDTFLILNLQLKRYEVWYKITDLKHFATPDDRMWRSVPIRFHHATGQVVH